MRVSTVSSHADRCIADVIGPSPRIVALAAPRFFTPDSRRPRLPSSTIARRGLRVLEVERRSGLACDDRVCFTPVSAQLCFQPIERLVAARAAWGCRTMLLVPLRSRGTASPKNLSRSCAPPECRRRRTGEGGRYRLFMVFLTSSHPRRVRLRTSLVWPTRRPRSRMRWWMPLSCMKSPCTDSRPGRFARMLSVGGKCRRGGVGVRRANAVGTEAEGMANRNLLPSSPGVERFTTLSERRWCGLGYAPPQSSPTPSAGISLRSILADPPLQGRVDSATFAPCPFATMIGAAAIKQSDV